MIPDPDATPTISFHYLCGGGKYARELTIMTFNAGEVAPAVIGTLAEMGHVELPTAPGQHWRLCDDNLSRVVCSVVADALPRQERFIIVPPPEAGAPPAGGNAFAGGKAKLQGLASRAHYNGSEVIMMYYVPERGRWAVHLDGGTANPNPNQLLVRPEHLEVLPAPHRATREGRLQAEASKLVAAAAAATLGGAVGFGTVAVADAAGKTVEEEVELPDDLVVLSLFPLLSRCTKRRPGAAAGAAAEQRWSGHITAGELDVAAAVCHSWRAAALALRALVPACARDVAVKLRLEGGTAAAAGPSVATRDGEYEVWHDGDRSQPPMTLWIHNVLSRRPSEFLTLPPTGNFSFIPASGTAAVPHEQPPYIATRFTKLRVCPWILRAKTDDMTFATSDGAARLQYNYWNGQRIANFTEVPYATARDVHMRTTHSLLLAQPGAVRGTAGIDLRGTGFGVDLTRFAAMGCGAAGIILLPEASARLVGRASETAVRGGDLEAKASAGAWQDHLFLVGGGYAGRCVPCTDTTADEVAAGGNYDNEGRNGGWVLELLMDTASATVFPVNGPIARPVVSPDEADGANNCRYQLSNSFRYHANTRYFVGGIDRLVD
jgi:hypothetical protein